MGCGNAKWYVGEQSQSCLPCACMYEDAVNLSWLANARIDGQARGSSSSSICCNGYDWIILPSLPPSPLCIHLTLRMQWCLIVPSKVCDSRASFSLLLPTQSSLLNDCFIAFLGSSPIVRPIIDSYLWLMFSIIYHIHHRLYPDQCHLFEHQNAVVVTWILVAASHSLRKLGENQWVYFLRRFHFILFNCRALNVSLLLSLSLSLLLVFSPACRYFCVYVVRASMNACEPALV